MTLIQFRKWLESYREYAGERDGFIISKIQDKFKDVLEAEYGLTPKDHELELRQASEKVFAKIERPVSHDYPESEYAQAGPNDHKQDYDCYCRRCYGKRLFLNKC